MFLLFALCGIPGHCAILVYGMLVELIIACKMASLDVVVVSV